MCARPGTSPTRGTRQDFRAATALGRQTSDNAPFAALLGNLLNGVKVSRLLVLPVGPLNGLPFAALPMPHGHARELLIDRLVVSAAPSLALAMHSAGKTPAPQTRIAVISDPIATHAVARRDAPEQSALFLKEYAADGTPLANDRLTVDDMARSGLRADVVVLSGCATGDGRELRGEGVIGLAYEFLANGSHTVVASLWPVEDALTARFMEEFDAAYRSSLFAQRAPGIAHRTAACARHVGAGGMVEFRRARQRNAVAARRSELTTNESESRGCAPQFRLK